MNNLSTFSSSISSSHFMSQFAIDPSTTTGLTLGYKAGVIVDGWNITQVSAGTLSLTANADNWVYVSSTTLAVATAPGLPGVLFKVTTDGSGITSIEDHRGTVPTNQSTFV